MINFLFILYVFFFLPGITLYYPTNINKIKKNWWRKKSRGEYNWDIVFFFYIFSSLKYMVIIYLYINGARILFLSMRHIYTLYNSNLNNLQKKNYLPLKSWIMCRQLSLVCDNFIHFVFYIFQCTFLKCIYP